MRRRTEQPWIRSGAIKNCYRLSLWRFFQRKFSVRPPHAGTETRFRVLLRTTNPSFRPRLSWASPEMAELWARAKSARFENLISKSIWAENWSRRENVKADIFPRAGRLSVATVILRWGRLNSRSQWTNYIYCGVIALDVSSIVTAPSSVWINLLGFTLCWNPFSNA